MYEILTSEVVAERLGVSDRRIRQLVNELRLEPRKIGNALVFSQDDLERMRARDTKPGPKPAEQKAAR